MKKKIFCIVFVVCTFFGASLLLIFFLLGDSFHTDSVKYVLKEPTSFYKGYRLAKERCVLCHVYPSPDVLPKSEWDVYLYRMATYMGLDINDLNFMNLEERVERSLSREAEALKELGVPPKMPLLTLDEFKLVWNYYRNVALKEFPPQPKKLPIKESKLFQPKVFNHSSKVHKLVSAVRFNPFNKHVYVGVVPDRVSKLNSKILVFDSQGKFIDQIEMAHPPISLQFFDGGFYLSSFFISNRSTKYHELVKYELKNGTNAPKAIIGNLYRTTDFHFVDFNRDGQQDILTTQFGGAQGQVAWYESKNNTYVEHVLINVSGALKAHVADFNQDKLPDFIVLMAASREGVYLFLNKGNGEFSQRTLVKYHPAFGYTDMAVADFNQDGYIDFATSNGNEDIGNRPNRPYQGIRVYVNDGHNQFQEMFYYPMLKPMRLNKGDFDGDGNMDLVAISPYVQKGNKKYENFVLLMNQSEKSNIGFEIHTVKQTNEHYWLAMDPADVDGDGDIDILLGAFNGFLNTNTTFTNQPELARFSETNTKEPSVWLLENMTF